MFSQMSPDYPDDVMDIIKVKYEFDTERKQVIHDPLPSLVDYPGEFDFNIKLSNPQQGKSSSFYSTILGQVFIDMNKVLLVHFELKAPEEGLFVRALPVYIAPEFSAVPVNRCTVHSVESDPNGSAHLGGLCQCSDYDNVGHVVRTHSKDAKYCYDLVSGRHSVVVPVKRLQAGSQSFAIAYYFTCKTSCPRGMQRRPINIVFTLETESGEVLGRKLLGVRICSCPKRDRERLERDYRKEIEVVPCLRAPAKRTHYTTRRKRKDSSYLSPLEKLIKEIKELDFLLNLVDKKVMVISEFAKSL